MIIDCVMFFNELDLLEIRLHSHAPYVERFVICECPVTHSGKPKPLYFEENKERFKGFNITHLIVDDYKDYMNWFPGDGLAERCLNAQKIENHQRDFMVNGIYDVDPETIIFISDADEILDLKNYKGEEGAFLQEYYCYYLNVYMKKGRGPIAIKKKNLQNFTGMTDARSQMKHRLIAGYGWHFTCLGTPEEILEKIDSCYHQNFNTEEVRLKLVDNRKNLVDPYLRARYNTTFTVQMPGGPQWLLKNKDRYTHLFFHEEGITEPKGENNVKYRDSQQECTRMAVYKENYR